MTMRGLIDSIILSDEQLMALIPEERWREANSTDDAPERPFAEYRWGITSSSVLPRHPVRSAVLQVYVHDDQGSFDARINPIIVRLKAVLALAAGINSPTLGASIIACDWMEDGPDTYDDGYRTAVRYTQFRVVGTGL